MPDVFITLEEAAAFESVSYKTLTQRIYRNPQQYKTKSQAREGGGKDQVLISTSSLSAKARKAWRAAQKVEGSEVIIDKRAQEAVPWYVTADLNQYTEANKKRFYEAVELAARVQDFIDYDGPDRTGYAERYALGLGISPQSLYRYMKNVLEANAWALKLEKEDGKSRDYFRALALCRKPKETGTFPSLTDEQKAIIENIWFDKRFAANLGTIEMLYERFELEAERREWEEYPSIKTVARYIKFLMGQRGAESARFLAANGTREWKNKRMMKGKRDATSLQVMEYVVGDEHTFDFWVQWTAPNGKIKAVRPKLVAWLDMRSRAIIGDVACVNANSQTLKESLVKMIYSNPGGVPHILHVDNGKDYTAKAMTGQNRKHRKIDLDFAFDSETVGFYQSIGIQEVGRSLPYQPWDKPIERFFSTVCSKFSKWFESYTGTLTGSKTYAKRQKDIDQMLERGELLTMEEFFEVWTEWKNTKYHTRKHRGLSDAGEKWVTPIEMFENGPRYEKAAPPREYPQISAQAGSYTFEEGVELEIYSSKSSYYDWAKIRFTSQFRPKLSLKKKDPATIQLGYDGTLEDVFTGFVSGNYDGGTYANEVALKDEMLLMEETIINDTFLDTTPQELISYFLAQAGLSKMKLSSKTYPTRKMLPIRRQTAVQAINAVNAAWGLRVPFFFSGGVFYWDEKPEQKKVYTFERGVNILNLRRAGGVWELETVSAPFIKHSHKINLIHPQVSGEVEVSKVVSKTNDSGFIRTYIYF